MLDKKLQKRRCFTKGSVKLFLETWKLSFVSNMEAKDTKVLFFLCVSSQHLVKKKDAGLIWLLNMELPGIKFMNVVKEDTRHGVTWRQIIHCDNHCGEQLKEAVSGSVSSNILLNSVKWLQFHIPDV